MSKPHTAAVQAWEKGSPKADSVSQARKDWAPFVSTWAAYIQGNFLGSLTHRVGRERVGWIDTIAFWTSFWTARGKDTKIQQQSENEQILHMRPYIEGAGAAGSMSFFATMPTEMMGIVRQVLVDTMVLVEPRVVQWYQNTDPLCSADVSVTQACLAKTLEWGTNEDLRLEHSRGEISVVEKIDLVHRVGDAYAFNDEDWCNAIGHLMHALPKDIERCDLVVQIQQHMGASLPPGVDVPLIAMCSGYDVGQYPMQHSIAGLGRHLTNVEDLGTKGLVAPPTIHAGSELFALLSALDTIERPKELYAAAMAMGLHRIAPMEAIVVDESLFSSFEP